MISKILFILFLIKNIYFLFQLQNKMFTKFMIVHKISNYYQIKQDFNYIIF